MASNGTTTPAGDGSATRRNVLKGATAAVGAFIALRALRVEPTSGARFIREDVCVACNRCAEACIFPTSPEANATNQLTYNQESRISYDPVKDNFTKCDLCYWREGGPACVERCPVNVRIRQGILKVEGGRMCLDVPK